MKKIIRNILIILLTISLSACANLKTTIAYTVYPIGYLIDRITGGLIESKSIQSNTMVQVSTINEDYKQILDNSTYFFHIGNLEPYMEIYKNDIVNTSAKSIDLSVLNSIYKFQRYSLVYVDGKGQYIEGPYYNGEIFDKIDTNENDLMLWMDPIGMLSMGQDIYEILSSNYIEEASRFKENFKKLENDLISLDAAYQSLAAKMKKQNKTIKFASISASFGNWQKAYGFQVYPICLSKYGALPTEAEIEIIKARIINDGVKYIAYEPNMTEEMTTLFNRIEDELGLTRVNLNNVSSLTPSQVANNVDYFSLMYENLSVLETMATGIIESGS